jgi:uncharacterized protein
MKKYILIITILFCCQSIFAQVDSSKRLSAMKRSYNNKIVLRLFPSNPSSLLVGNKKGYKVQRADFAQGDIASLNYADIKNPVSIRITEDSGVSYIINKKITDTLELKMAGLAYGLTEQNALPQKGDVLADGVSSLKDKQQDESMKFFMVNIACNKSKLASIILGLWIEDEQVELGKTYAYRVKINDEKNDWFYIKVTCENFNPNYLLNERNIKLNEGDTKVDFNFPEGYDYYAFNIDRSNFTKDAYKRMNKEPIVKINPTGTVGKVDYTFGDSSLTNYKKYFYKVWVNTPFGDEMLFADFAAMPRDKTAPTMPAIKTANHVNPAQVEIKWEMEDKINGDLKGFTVKRGSKNEGPFTQITQKALPSNARTFIDESFEKNGENYYVLEAVDTAGNKIESYPAYVTLIDSTPPAIPVVAKATIDSVGKITIKVKPNTEKDFMGYQLLKANAEDHEFSVEQETFKDSLGATTFVLYDSTTLQSLTPKIYYKLVAFDTHYNQSEPSQVIILKRPDTIAPVSPIITNYKVADTTVTIVFVNSSSDDVVANYLLRKEVGKQKFDTIFTNKENTIEKFKDKKFIGGKEYEYTMVAKDEGNLFSKKSRSLFIKTLLNNELPVPIIQAVFNEKQKAVTINYKLNGQLKSKKATIEIYRRTAIDADWVILKAVAVDINKPIIDEKLPNTTSVFYIAKIVDENNNSSTFSKPIILNIK